MRTASDQRTRCAVHAAHDPDLVPHRGASAARFVASERARVDARAAAGPPRASRAALAANVRGASAAVGHASAAQVQSAPWKDHELCNPLDFDRARTRSGARRAEAPPDRRRIAYKLRAALRPI